MTGKKEEEKKEYGDSSLALLRDVKKALDKAVKGSEVSCVLVSTIENELKKDPRTVRHYLNILAEAEYGKFSKDGKLFCPKNAEQKNL